MRVGFLVTRFTGMDATWTTIHLAMAALQLGHEVRFLVPDDIEVSPAGRLVARTSVVDPNTANEAALAAALESRSMRRSFAEVARLDMVVMRVNPLPLQILGAALMMVEAGVPVVNNPAGVAMTSSKAWITTLSDVPQPRTVVTRSAGAAELFAGNLEGPVVLKPLIGSGGRGVMLARGRRSLYEALEHCFRSPGAVIIQEYLAAAEQGEKRLFMVDGQVIGAYLRRRPRGGFRHNLRQGGTPERCELSAGDLRIAKAIGPHLLRNGIRIAGLDVIGERLVEVNTLNPGGVHYAQRFGAEGMALRAMSQMLEQPRLGREVR